MELRRALPEDLEAAGEVSVRAYAAFTLGDRDPYIARLRDAAARAREAELWVAVDDDRVLGCVTACPPGSPWREVAGTGEGEFRILAVLPEAQGRGIGRALVERCEGRARDHGARAMVLSTLAEMSEAHRLYTRLGYRRAPERDWSPAPAVPLIAYTRELS